VAAPTPDLILDTLSVRLVGHTVVFVSPPGRDIADPDWSRYVSWVRSIVDARGEVGILVAGKGRPPSSAQRSLFSREIAADRIRLAVLVSDRALLPILRVAAWLVRSARPFGPQEIEPALVFLNEPEVEAVRQAIHELGG
jgi:hypothetical protein